MNLAADTSELAPIIAFVHRIQPLNGYMPQIDVGLICWLNGSLLGSVARSITA